jgi:hypothetical protein
MSDPRHLQLSADRGRPGPARATFQSSSHAPHAANPSRPSGDIGEHWGMRNACTVSRGRLAGKEGVRSREAEGW